MRDIKFRGKSVTTGKWVIGDLVQGTSSDEKYILPFTDNLKEQLNTVDPATVGQFTGLVGKNGVEIYEGDVIKVYHFIDYTGCDRYMYKEIVWKEDTAQWYFKAHGKEHNQLYVLLKNSDCEVIGTIHNPKLLGVYNV